MIVREPGGTAFGEKVRDAVQGNHDYEVVPMAALLAYMSARANLVEMVIRPALGRSENVWADRYWYSSYAYQGALGVDRCEILRMASVTTGNLRPDLVVHLDLGPKEAMRRRLAPGQADVDRYDVAGLEFHTKVRQNYWELAEFLPEIWKVIDASLPAEEVYCVVMGLLRAEGIIS